MPLEPALREGADDGVPVVVGHPESPAAVAIRDLAAAIDQGRQPLLGAQRIRRTLPIA